MKYESKKQNFSFLQREWGWGVVEQCKNEEHSVGREKKRMMFRLNLFTSSTWSKTPLLRSGSWHKPHHPIPSNPIPHLAAAPQAPSQPKNGLRSRPAHLSGCPWRRPTIAVRPRPDGRGLRSSSPSIHLTVPYAPLGAGEQSFQFPTSHPQCWLSIFKTR